MANIYILLLICIFIWYFFHMRKISEKAVSFAQNYCQQSNLQYISTARRSSRLQFSKQDGFYWLSIFDMEFNGDGDSNNIAVMSLLNLKLKDIVLPVYRIQ